MVDYRAPTDVSDGLARSTLGLRLGSHGKRAPTARSSGIQATSNFTL